MADNETRNAANQLIAEAVEIAEQHLAGHPEDAATVAEFISVAGEICDTDDPRAVREATRVAASLASQMPLAGYLRKLSLLSDLSDAETILTKPRLEWTPQQIAVYGGGYTAAELAEGDAQRKRADAVRRELAKYETPYPRRMTA